MTNSVVALETKNSNMVTKNKNIHLSTIIIHVCMYTTWKRLCVNFNVSVTNCIGSIDINNKQNIDMVVILKMCVIVT